MEDIDPSQLETMRKRGGTWAAYRNEALDSAHAGQFIFLAYGEGRTFTTPPDTAPDGPYGAGWKYCLFGRADLENGKVIPDV